MAAKIFVLACASSLLLHLAQSAIMGGFASPYGFAGTGCGYTGFAAPFDGFTGPVLPYDSFASPYDGFGYSCNAVASTGGGLPCSSASPIPPLGVTVRSENVYEGPLTVGGSLPFLGTVTFEGVLPTAGLGAVSYGCGNSICAIGAEEGAIATGIAPYAPSSYASYGGYSLAPAAAYNGFSGFTYGPDCGYGAMY